MKVLICGSRDFERLYLVTAYVQTLGRDDEVIHGGAVGVDRTAGRAARARGLKVTEMPADWENYGRRAGVIRNREMLKLGPDLVVAFWDGKSKGTANMIEEAEKAGVKVMLL